eukprot:3043357-Rhodomonas_salina.1
MAVRSYAMAVVAYGMAVAAYGILVPAYQHTLWKYLQATQLSPPRATTIPYLSTGHTVAPYASSVPGIA